jgi:hypothetical protein
MRLPPLLESHLTWLQGDALGVRLYRGICSLRTLWFLNAAIFV